MRRLGVRLLQRGDDGRWLVGIVGNVICGDNGRQRPRLGERVRDREGRAIDSP